MDRISTIRIDGTPIRIEMSAVEKGLEDNLVEMTEHKASVQDMFLSMRDDVECLMYREDRYRDDDNSVFLTDDRHAVNLYKAIYYLEKGV